MDIDWFTWLAQIINFVILVALLRHFLYGRIIGAIDAREEKIASRWHDAEKEKEKASHEADEYRSRQQELEQQQSEILSKAKQEAEEQREEWIQQAREEVDEARRNWQTALEKQQESFVEDLRRTVAAEVTAAVRKALRDLADADLESRTLEQFKRQLGESDSEAGEMRELVRQAGEKLTVFTAFDLSQEQRDDLRNTIKERADKDVEVTFGTSEALVWGVEVRANGQKVAWSAQDYVDGLEQKVRQMLEKRRQRGREEKGRSEEGPEEQKAEPQEQKSE